MAETSEPPVDQPPGRGNGRAALDAISVPIIGGGLGFALALPITMVLASASGPSSGEGDGLGLLFAFVVLWFASFVLVSAAVSARMMRRSAGRTHRLVRGLLYFGWLPLSAATSGVAAWFGYHAGLEFVGAALGAVVAVGLLRIAGVLPYPDRVRKALFTMFGVIALFVVAIVAFKPGYRESLYAANPPPLAVVDQAELGDALPGWEVAGYEDAPRDRRWPFARVIVTTAAGDHVEVNFIADIQSCQNSRNVCENVGVTEDGSAIVVSSDYATCGFQGPPAHVWMYVDRPEGVWQADVKSGCASGQEIEADDLRVLMMLMRPVTVAEWVDAT